MVEEAKKAEETKPEEEEESKGEETKDEKESKGEDAGDAPAPPQEIVLKVFMHCEGCARKVRRSLKGFPGVEDVITDCKSSIVVVKGEKADPSKVLERVQGKSHRVVELVSPIPTPPAEEKTVTEEEEPKPDEEEKKEEAPQIVIVVLKVHMHCEACAQEMKKRIEKIKGVESAEADLKKWEVTVKGVIEPSKLIEYVYKRFGKHAMIVKQEVAATEEEEEKKETAEEEVGEKENEEEKKTEGEEENKGEGNEEAKAQEEKDAVTEETKAEEMKMREFSYFNPAMNGMELYHATAAAPAPYANFYNYYYYYQKHPPQIFSDENPNACTIM